MLPDNRLLAERRLNPLRRKLQCDGKLKAKYFDTMKDHLTKGYINLASNVSRRWYLPHHPVLNPKKPEKLRIVLDCAASFEGRSLNDALLSGPDWTNKLIGVLSRFR